MKVHRNTKIPAAPAFAEWVPRVFTTAVQHQQAGRLTEARDLLVHLLEREPRHTDSMYFLASIAAQSGELSLAGDLLRQAISIEPRKAPYFVLLGNVLQREVRLDESATCYRQALMLDPASSDAHYNLANTLERQGRCHDATEHFEQAVALRPDFVEAQNNLGKAYHIAGRLEDAAKCLEFARALAPWAMPVHLNLGNVYMAQSRLEDALACFDKAIELMPGYAQIHNNRGNALRQMGRIHDSLEAYRRAIALAPQSPEFYVNQAHSYQAQGRMADALASFRHVLALAPGEPAVHGAALFTLHYDPLATPQSLLEEHRRWGKRFGKPAARHGKPFSNLRDPEKLLRVGYVSGDFRQHPVAIFTAPVFAAHDRSRLEVYAYSGVSRPDGWTQRIEGAVDHWRTYPGWSDLELAERIEADGIDILIDLSGHTAGNRLLALARKPAPIQASWLGYFNTTGLDAIDYLVVDSVVAPPEEVAPFVEQPLRLDGCYLSYQLPGYAPPRTPAPATSNPEVTLGCFNALSKITPEVVACWSRILRQIPSSRIVLRNQVLGDPASRERYHEEFERHGIERSRIHLLPAAPHAELLAFYSHIDLALDPFPYNGGTTTCEALSMGVPVVTLRGDRFVGRVGATILTHAGYPELIAETVDDYVTTAVTLAGDVRRLSELHTELGQRVPLSRLCDVAGFTRSLETAYRESWRTWCGT